MTYIFPHGAFRCCQDCSKKTDDCWRSCKAIALEKKIKIAKKHRADAARRKHMKAEEFFHDVVKGGIAEKEREKQRRFYAKKRR